MLLIGIVIGVIMAYCLINRSGQRSLNYRKVMANMFVVGRIKQLAKDKDINLAEEFEDYKRFMKKSRLQDVDDSIEQDLIDEVGEQKAEKDIKKK